METEFRNMMLGFGFTDNRMCRVTIVDKKTNEERFIIVGKAQMRAFICEVLEELDNG